MLSWSYWLFVYLPWWNIYSYSLAVGLLVYSGFLNVGGGTQGFVHTLWKVLYHWATSLTLVVSSKNSLNFIDIVNKAMICKFFLILWVVFSLYWWCLWCVNISLLMIFIYCFLCCWWFGIISKNCLPHARSWRLYLGISLRGLGFSLLYSCT
jgi:hypothetical protein